MYCKYCIFPENLSNLCLNSSFVPKWLILWQNAIPIWENAHNFISFMCNIVAPPKKKMKKIHSNMHFCGLDHLALGLCDQYTLWCARPMGHYPRGPWVHRTNLHKLQGPKGPKVHKSILSIL
jgi:hypothetical protein